MKRMITFIATIFLLVSALPLATTPVSADGIIICDPGICPEPIPLTPLSIRYHNVDISIQDQIVVTHIDQVFHNPTSFQVEGTYIFPLPNDAVVTNFILWVDGKPVEGQILEGNQARQIYEDIVQQIKDPALLEYIGRGLFKASIFPIPPNGERRIELEYSQVLTVEDGLLQYIYPLSTEKFSTLPLENVSIHVDIESTTAPIRAVYSPTHQIAVSRENAYYVTVGYEDSNVIPSSDFTLYYSIGETEAFHLLTYREADDPIDPDGFFLLLLAPQVNDTVKSVAKDIILVIDRSGSMEGEKFQQAKEALHYILARINPNDHFNVISFNTGVDSYAHDLRSAEEANEAADWVDRMSAVGSTNINRALLEAAAMADQERPTYIIFLTDGLPTEGETVSQRIIDNFQAAAGDNLRLFVFGVGYDVDTYLLDSLSDSHHGTSTYVLPSDPLNEMLSSFYAKISMPVLTNLQLDFDGVMTHDMYPSPLPDLFAGSQIVVTGRYRKGGDATVTLTGLINGHERSYTFTDQFFTQTAKGNESESTIPRLWATRKIGYLLNKIRLEGADEETIEQIVRLSIRFGIVTPYTSYLVTEEAPLGHVEQDRIADEAYHQIQSTPSAPTYGAEAVQKASDQAELESAEAVSNSMEGAADRVVVVGAHTFVNADGIWIDTVFDPQTMQTTRVGFLSEDYFALITNRPDLAAAFALGPRVIAVSAGTAYEVVAEGENVDPIEIPPSTSSDEKSQQHVTAPNNQWLCAGTFLPLMILLGLYLSRRTR